MNFRVQHPLVSSANIHYLNSQSMIGLPQSPEHPSFKTLTAKEISRILTRVFDQTSCSTNPHSRNDNAEVLQSKSKGHENQKNSKGFTNKTGNRRPDEAGRRRIKRNRNQSSTRTKSQLKKRWSRDSLDRRLG
ncbi:hypothetical protein Droror1_Dr00007138 [Drosera rotundifolia]